MKKLSIKSVLIMLSLIPLITAAKALREYYEYDIVDSFAMTRHILTQ